MRSLLIALLALLVIHLLAVGAGVAWLAATDRLSGERVQEAIAVFKPTIEAERTAAAEAEAAAEEAARAQQEALHLAQVADGSKTLEEHMAGSRRVDDVMTQRVERLKREREDILRQIEQAKALIEDQREQIAARERAFEDRVEAYQARREDDDFQQAVRMLEQLKAAQAKQVLQDMIAAGDQETAVAYLAAMNPRKAGALLREFKEPQDIEQARVLIEALRKQGMFAANG